MKGGKLGFISKQINVNRVRKSRLLLFVSVFSDEKQFEGRKCRYTQKVFTTTVNYQYSAGICLVQF